MSFQNILVPVDDSPISYAAVEHALSLAKLSNATVTLLSVVAVDPFVGVDFYQVAPAITEHFMQAEAHAKTQLQERLQGQKLPTPKYEIVAIDGAAHEQLFTVSCEIPALQIRTQGEGSTRRLAEQHAASLAMVQLNDGAPTGTKSAKRS